MKERKRNGRNVRKVLLLFFGVVAMLTYCGPVAPRHHVPRTVLDEVTIPAASHAPVGPDVEHGTVGAPSTPLAIDRKPVPDEVAVAKAPPVDRNGLPSFRKARITRGAVGSTTTLRGKNGFSIRFPAGAHGTRNGIWVAPAVYGGLLVTGGPSGSHAVHAFDARSGEPVWTVNLEDNGPSAPACAEGVCAFTTESCSLYVVDAKSGRPLWGKWLADPLLSAPAIADGKVFATYPRWPEGEVVAFRARTGEVVWARRLDEDVMSAPAVRGGVVSLTTLTGSQFRFAAATGEPRGVARGKDPVLAFAGAHDGHDRNARPPSANGAAYHVLRPVSAPEESRALWLRDRSIVTLGTGVVLATSATDEVEWIATIDATTAPIAAGGSIWVGANRDVLALDRNTGTVERTIDVGSRVTAEPVLVDGWLYAATVDGLVAVDLADPTFTGWSQWGGDAARTSTESAETVVGSSGSLALSAP